MVNRMSLPLILGALTACAGAPVPASAPSRVPASATYWEPLPTPPAGIVRALARTREGVLLAGAMTGVYAMGDTARGWRLLGLEGRLVESLLVTRLGTLLAGVYRGGLYRSPDGGRTWAHVGFEWSNYVPALAEDVEGRIYVAVLGALQPGAPTGVLRSTDDGRSWTPAGLHDLDVNSLSTPGDGALYAGTTQGLRRSMDGGVTWTDAGSGLPPTAVVSTVVRYGGALLAGTRRWMKYTDLPAEGVFRSDDGGRRWQPARGGLPENISIRALAVVGDTAFAAADTSGTGVYRSLDARTWQPAGLQGRMLNTLLVAGPGRLLAGDEGSGAFASADGGRTWVQHAAGFREWDVGPVVAAPDGRLFAGDLRGVFRSADGGRTWEAPTAQFMALSLTRAPDGRLFAGTGAGRLYASSSGDASWDAIPLGSDGDVREIWFDERGHGLAALRNDTLSLYGTSDGGSTWRRIALDSGPEGIHAAISTPAGVVIAATGRGIQRFENGAWEVLVPGRRGSAKKLAACGGAVYAGMRGAGVLRSTDEGRTWTPVAEALRSSGERTQPGILWVDAMLCLPGGRLLIGSGVGGDGVFGTEDGGATWRNLSSGLLSRGVFGLATDGRGRIFAGTEAGVHRASVEALFGRQPRRRAGGPR